MCLKLGAKAHVKHVDDVPNEVVCSGLGSVRFAATNLVGEKREQTMLPSRSILFSVWGMMYATSVSAIPYMDRCCAFPRAQSR